MSTDNFNAVLEPTDELTLRLPWPLTVKVACQAMISGRTWNQQIRIGLEQGLRKVDQDKREFRAMVKANKATPKVEDESEDCAPDNSYKLAP
jgi:hypothetical protein